MNVSLPVQCFRDILGNMRTKKKLSGHCLLSLMVLHLFFVFQSRIALELEIKLALWHRCTAEVHIFNMNITNHT